MKHRLVTAAQMKEIERAGDAHGLPYLQMMENAGLDAVKDVLQEMLREDKIYIERVIPYAQAGVLQLVRNKGELVSEEYVPEGISIRAYVPMEVYGKL